jgi:hypothetical protein
VAKEEGESVSTLIRMAIKKHLKERAEGWCSISESLIIW